ncbi:DUF3631 domain-containing protein [Geodermatophilus sp. YIM 151500]|uniref:DUF3631 domain-containing protein n=1 Tax=Geodermatophilus sp. YIM 151500 TaxID=2984531 RepID=UPI0021E3B293|nr:DUF3631 domain-containing protein [Geodermatophilus sp. YIM 151500]MCV2489452.1 DUF3631 domain-containing protein [Geodermatophilus sp. YIM 151500]
MSDPWLAEVDLDEGVPVSGSAGSAAVSGFPERADRTGYDADGLVLDEVRAWLGRFISTMTPADLDLLTLWAAHTWLVEETYSTPRLVLDSPVPGAGKTTVLEHLLRLCRAPVQIAALSSPALLTRMLDTELRTLLIDEVDRTLAPNKDGVTDLVAILNSGYKRGATRPVLVPVKGGGWEPKEMPTFAPVAMAGNNPNLPGDTRSRCIRVLLMPDDDIEESDWERIEDDAALLGARLAAWADDVRDRVRNHRPDLPPLIKGRARERWLPLKRVAAAAGDRWPALVDVLAVADVKRIQLEQEEGLMQQQPAVVLLKHIHKVWSDTTASFIATEDLIDRLVSEHPEMWGEGSSFGKRLTAQRLGRMLVTAYDVHASRPHTQGPRGYLRASFTLPFSRFHLAPLHEPDKAAQPAGPDTDRPFVKLTGPGRCPGCGWHVETQGHEHGCNAGRVA